MAYYDEALLLARELEDQWLIVYAMYHQGFAALFGGDPQKAMGLFKNCLSHFPQYSDKLIIAYILWGVGETAVMQGKSVLAARMFGAGESLSEEIGWVIPKAHRAIYDFFLATLRTQLDETTFAAAWMEGRSMTMERAIQFALDELNK
jgi:hypothetical protein